MVNSPIRRSQLIAPFGVGSLFITKEGISLIGAGLDHWFDEDAGTDPNLDLDEFYLDEWRLQRELGVDFFRLPPDFRRPRRYDNEAKNTNLIVPYLRFSTWHFCQRCGRMQQYPLTERGQKQCTCEGRGAMVQVPIVAICDNGHIQDFPWNEWVHASSDPACGGELNFGSTGVGGLRGLRVLCRSCSKARNLEGVLTAAPSGDMTDLTSKLQKGSEYWCEGHTPWLYEQGEGGCGRPLRGALRSSTNIYYAQQASAIFLPRNTTQAALDPDLEELLTRPPISSLRQLMGDGVNAQMIRMAPKCAKLIEPYTDDQIDKALAILSGDGGVEEAEQSVEGDDPHTAFRRWEFNALLQRRNDKQLIVTPVALDEYESDISVFFSRICLIEKLKETRALRGFTRVFPESDMDDASLQRLLRARPPEDGEAWLPACVVFGEGVFLCLDEERLQEWEAREDVRNRVEPLVGRYQQLQEQRRLRDRQISARFLLLHSLSHILLNRLTFESGYSTASLRERLFISSNPKSPMAGLLIYTAAGDSEGTLGGLVRMGKPDFLEPVIRKAIEEARWCGADPVCMEAGDMGGQGPDSCNIAACHNCALIPETACEEFNRFLDRGLVVGSLQNPDLGFFNDL